MTRRFKRIADLSLAALLASLLGSWGTVYAVWQGATKGSVYSSNGLNDYDAATNWVGGLIDDNFAASTVLKGNLTVFLDADRTTVDAGLQFGFNGGHAYNLTLRGEGANRTFNLAGDVTVGCVDFDREVTIGSTIANQQVNVNLNGNRNVTVAYTDKLTFFNSINDGSVPSGLTKLGDGTLVLYGQNNYSGTTAVNEGALLLGGSDKISDVSAVVLADTLGVKLDLNTFSDTIGSLAGGGQTWGNVTLGAGGSLAVGANNQSTVYSGVISGISGRLTKIGSGMLTLTNPTSSFSGGLTVSGGLLNAEGAFTEESATIGAASNSPLGSGPILINGAGAELRVRNGYNSPNATVAMERNVAFSNGGALNFTGRNKAGNGFSVNTGTAGGAAAVIKYADGWDPTAWNFNNSFRLNGVTGSAPLRLELTNGAIATVLGDKNFGPSVTIRGVAVSDGGDPAAPSGSLAVGRFGLTGSSSAPSTLNAAAGLTFENAVQVTTSGATRTIQANLYLAPGAKVGFQGGASQTAYDSLVLGASPGDRLTISDGAEANLDSRFRTEGARQGGVWLKATTVIKPGGTLRLRQSYNPGSGDTGYHQIDGDIQGEGATVYEAVLDVLLSNKTAAGGPTGGVNWTASTAKLVVNGAGAGGLRIQGTAAHLAGLLGDGPASRLATLSGSGGYLTIAPSDTVYMLPPGSQWGDSGGTAVGLKVVNSVAGGADLSLVNYETWNRNVLVDAGATLEVALARTTFTGIVTGSGVISGGPVVIGGTHAGTGGGPLEVDSVELEQNAVLKSDVDSSRAGALGDSPGLKVDSSLTWNGQVVKAGAGTYTLAYCGSGANVTIAPSGAKLIIAEGVFRVAGAGDPFTQLGDTPKSLDVENNATLNITEGEKQIGLLSGTQGALVLGPDATLTAASICQDTVTIGMGSRSISRGSASLAESAAAAGLLPDVVEGRATAGDETSGHVPEPGTWWMLIAGALSLLLLRLRTFARSA